MRLAAIVTEGNLFYKSLDRVAVAAAQGGREHAPPDAGRQSRGTFRFA
jgi:hypothetical protein